LAPIVRSGFDEEERMPARRLLLTLVGLLIILPLLYQTWGTSAQSTDDPTAVAIQTRIARLETTLTAIASEATPVVAATPMGRQNTFKYKDFTFTFTSSERGNSLGGERGSEPDGVYLFVYFEVTNNGDRSAHIPGYNRFIVTDGAGREFHVVPKAAFHMARDYQTIGKVQPGLVYESVVVFDVRKRSKSFVLTLPGSDIKYKLEL